VKVELWGDVVCPWCYLGRRRFERVLAESPNRESVEVVLRSFELDPEAPASADRTLEERLRARYGLSVEQAQAAIDRVSRVAAGEGLEYHLERARPTNTLDAHRILQLAQVRHRRREVEERFDRAYFVDGEVLSDHAVLLRLASEAGLDSADVRRVLAGQAFTLQVRADEREAHELGAHGVPYFVFDRARVVEGAQSADVLRLALDPAARIA